jgi:hypothetical protein
MFAILHALEMFVADLFKSRSRLEAENLLLGHQLRAPPRLCLRGGEWEKTLMGVGGAIAAPMTAYQYDWNMLPIGQALWLKELQTYIDFPPLQNPASYNLEQVMQQVREMKSNGLSD